MFRIISLVVILGTVAVCLGHFILFGIRRAVERDASGRRLYRFSFWERLVHLLTVASFLLLAVTGFMAALIYQERLGGWLWVYHLLGACVFSVAVVVTMLIWARDGCFASHDWEWVRKMGGYLQHGAHVPAGRFNAGQKGYFWGVGVLGLASMVSGMLLAWPVLAPEYQSLVLLVHRYGALAFVFAGLGHLYLTTGGNPGTWQAMVTGWVDMKWAEHHHPVWYRRATGSGAGEHGDDEAH